MAGRSRRPWFWRTAWYAKIGNKRVYLCTGPDTEERQSVAQVEYDKLVSGATRPDVVRIDDKRVREISQVLSRNPEMVETILEVLKMDPAVVQVVLTEAVKVQAKLSVVIEAVRAVNWAVVFQAIRSERLRPQAEKGIRQQVARAELIEVYYDLGEWDQDKWLRMILGKDGKPPWSRFDSAKANLCKYVGVVCRRAAAADDQVDESILLSSLRLLAAEYPIEESRPLPTTTTASQPPDKNSVPVDSDGRQAPEHSVVPSPTAQELPPEDWQKVLEEMP